ncbi:MAG: hypothetical protein EA428_02565 [Spirochaetaceae bacterium]|nr:MAG: hypothetical protein EA428_02565 [Spirochaetaceae bacterium]
MSISSLNERRARAHGRVAVRQALKYVACQKELGGAGAASTVPLLKAAEMRSENPQPVVWAEGAVFVYSLLAAGKQVFLPQWMRSGGVVGVFQVTQIPCELYNWRRERAHFADNVLETGLSGLLTLVEIVAFDLEEQRKKRMSWKPVGAHEMWQIVLGNADMVKKGVTATAHAQALERPFLLKIAQKRDVVLVFAERFGLALEQLL